MLTPIAAAVPSALAISDLMGRIVALCLVAAVVLVVIKAIKNRRG